MVIWLSGLQTIPQDMYEAGAIDGANNWQRFRYLTWPALRQTRTFILITITIQAFALFTQIQAQANRYADTAALFQALGGGWWHRPDLVQADSIRKDDEK